MMPTLLEWLLKRYPDTPKKRAKQWILAGRVSVKGVVIRRLQENLTDPCAELKLLSAHAAQLDCGTNGWPIHPRVTLLHLDSALAIVNKGPGLLSVSAHRDDLSALSILADVLSGTLRVTRVIPPSYRRWTPLPVHRLDQFTSGVFCLAMNPLARQHLIGQLQAHTMRREYVAYVEGCPASSAGTWKNWLKPSADGLRQFVVDRSEGTVEAITHYEVIRKYQSVTQLRLRLETGRKHQIRAQAAYAGLPLVGDRTYHPRYRGTFPRQALHAETLTLVHPDNGDLMTWTASLPKDLRQLESILSQHRF